MRAALILLLAVVMLSPGAQAFSFASGGCATAGCATGEQFLASNANELDAAIDALEAVALDADVLDLADGTLTGSKVGSGINAANVTTGQIAIANGGTGASSASGARTALGLVIGTDVQAFDSDLAAIALLTTTAFGRGLLDDADATVARVSLGLVIGTNVQAFDADLADLADGSLSGSKVGPGIDAGNITTGTLPEARLPSTATLDSELRTLTISTIDPTDGTSACVEGDTWLNHSGTGKVCYCVDAATDDWSCAALSVHP